MPLSQGKHLEEYLLKVARDPAMSMQGLTAVEEL
jgi:hypothetical protein